MVHIKRIGQMTLLVAATATLLTLAWMVVKGVGPATKERLAEAGSSGTSAGSRLPHQTDLLGQTTGTTPPLSGGGGNGMIEFYGLVIDERDEPIPGVRVSLHAARWNPDAGAAHTGGVPSADFKTNSVTTDQLGRFAVAPRAGWSLTVVFVDERFELAPESPSTFVFGSASASPHTPDPMRPVVFRMWRRTGGVELIERRISRKLRADGTPLALDLETGLSAVGSASARGLIARVWREPLEFDYRTATPDVWRYELAFPEGRLRSTEEVFCYLAPEEGYESSVEETIRRGEGNYRYRAKRKFYVLTGRRLYGRGVLEVWADRMDETALVEVQVWLNPDGGRNLEPKQY